jgi:VIT1/CCC1 family predicted Fe2+/Mn2+ transporter
MNPYQTPADVPLARDPSRKWAIGEHLQSNRAISVVMGVPGIVFTAIGMIPILAAVAPSNPHENTVPVAVLGVGVALTVLGIGLLSVAIFLWRYRPPEDGN